MREFVHAEAADERLRQRAVQNTGLEGARKTLASARLTLSDFLACLNWLQWSPHQADAWLADVERAYERWLPVWPKPCRYQARNAMFRLRFIGGNYVQARRLIPRKLTRWPSVFEWQECFDLALALHDPELVWRFVERVIPFYERAEKACGPSEHGCLLAACISYWASRPDNFLVFEVCCEMIGKSTDQFAAQSHGADRKARNFDAALNFHWACMQAFPATLRILRQPQAAATRQIVSEMESLYFQHQLRALIKLLEAGCERSSGGTTTFGWRG
jgi:hypothetical protein